jgi:transcriptional regulator with XRE-family HTH domain
MKRRSERERTAFGRRMLRARKDAGLTQTDVCAQLGMSQSTLSELETDANSSGRIAELASLYGADAHYLATGEYAAPVGLPPTQGDEVDPWESFLTNLAQVPPSKRNEALLAASAAVVGVRFGTYDAKRRAALRAADASNAPPAPAPTPARPRSPEKAPTSGRAAKRTRTVR